MTEHNRLPERVDPRRLAAARGSLEGDVDLAAMSRLQDYLLEAEVAREGRASAALTFREDEQRRVVAEGRIQARLTLQCQRCLGPMQWPVDVPVRVVVVSDDETAAQVPREYEPVVVGPEGLDPASLVEDELILALPAVARHEPGECDGEPAVSSRRAHRDNPFAVLADWKSGSGDDTGSRE